MFILPFSQSFGVHRAAPVDGALLAAGPCNGSEEGAREGGMKEGIGVMELIIIVRRD